MTDSIAKTRFDSKVDAESSIESQTAVNILQDTMEDIADERATLEDVEFKIEDGKAHFSFQLNDDNGYKQETHKEIVSNAIERVIEHPGNGNMVDYASNRIEVDEDESDAE